MRGRAGAVTLAEGVTAGDQCDGLFVVHRHAREGFTHVTARRDWVGLTVRPFRVHVDEAHLHSGQRVLQVPVSGIALVAKPGVLAAPVDILFRFPDVLAPTTETEGLESHRL